MVDDVPEDYWTWIGRNQRAAEEKKLESIKGTYEYDTLEKYLRKSAPPGCCITDPPTCRSYLKPKMETRLHDQLPWVVTHDRNIEFGRKAVLITCPHCKKYGPTVVKSWIDLETYLAAIFTLFIGCGLGCWILPFFVHDVRTYEHHCAYCYTWLIRKRVLWEYSNNNTKTWWKEHEEHEKKWNKYLEDNFNNPSEDEHY